MKNLRNRNKLCAMCNERPAIFFRHGQPEVHRATDHDLCPRCHRDIMNRNMAGNLAQQGRVQALSFESAATPIDAAA